MSDLDDILQRLSAAHERVSRMEGRSRGAMLAAIMDTLWSGADPLPPAVPTVGQYQQVSRARTRIPPEYSGFNMAAWLEERIREHPLPSNMYLVQSVASQMLFKDFLPDGEFVERHQRWIRFWKRDPRAIPGACKFEKYLVDRYWAKDPVSAEANPAENDGYEQFK